MELLYKRKGLDLNTKAGGKPAFLLFSIQSVYLRMLLNMYYLPASIFIRLQVPRNYSVITKLLFP